MANDGNKPDTFGIRCTCPSCKGASGKGTLIGVIRDGAYIVEDTTAKSYKSAGKVRCTGCKAEDWPDVAKHPEHAAQAKRQEERIKANAAAIEAGGMAWEAGIGVVKAEAEAEAEAPVKAPKAAGSPPARKGRIPASQSLSVGADVRHGNPDGGASIPRPRPVPVAAPAAPAAPVPADPWSAIVQDIARYALDRLAADLPAALAAEAPAIVGAALRSAMVRQ